MGRARLRCARNEPTGPTSALAVRSFCALTRFMRLYPSDAADAASEVQELRALGCNGVVSARFPRAEGRGLAASSNRQIPSSLPRALWDFGRQWRRIMMS